MRLFSASQPILLYLLWITRLSFDSRLNFLPRLLGALCSEFMYPGLPLLNSSNSSHPHPSHEPRIDAGALLSILIVQEKDSSASSVPCIRLLTRA